MLICSAIALFGALLLRFDAFEHVRFSHNVQPKNQGGSVSPCPMVDFDLTCFTCVRGPPFDWQRRKM